MAEKLDMFQRPLKTKREAARLLCTADENITALIELGYLKTIHITNNTMIPDTEISRCIAEIAGKDIRNAIAEKKTELKINKQVVDLRDARGRKQTV